MITIETDRLLLRGWKEDDVLPFYEMGQDKRVMEHFPNLWSMEAVHIAKHVLYRITPIKVWRN